MKKEPYKSLKINIVGSGRVARALAASFFQNDIAVNGVFARNEKVAREIAISCNSSRSGSIPEGLPYDGITFMAVSDQAIEEVSILINPNEKVHLVHCSGAMDLSVLGNHQSNGGSFHPIQTIQENESGSCFEGSTISILSNNSMLSGELSNIAIKIGANPLFVDAHQKRILHIAAVFASNYMNTLLYQVTKIEPQLNLENQTLLNVLRPIILQTAGLVSSEGTKTTLTGPISRGDITTLETHLNMLKSMSPELSQLYKRMGVLTASQALEIGFIDTDSHKKIIDTLRYEEE